MARSLTFTLGGQSYAASVANLDRKKLYGFRKRQVLDDKDQACKLGQLCEDGQTLIGPGGVALAYLDTDGEWVERASMRAVDADGAPLPLIPSSYDAPIVLTEKLTLDELAAITVKDVFQLTPEEGSGIRDAVGEDCYRFVYNYRADYAANVAVLLNTPEGLFALVGEEAPYLFVGLEAQAQVTPEDEAEDLGDDDLDFGMM